MYGGYIRYLFPPRSYTLPIIRGDRVDLFKRIAGVNPEEEDESDVQMSAIQFITASTMYQINIYYLIIFIDILLASGGVNVFFSFLPLHIFLSIPLLVLFIFMSSYSKKGFLCMWECVPMFSGLGYSLLLCRLTFALFQVFFTFVPCLLLIDLMTSPTFSYNFRNCPGDTNNVCFPMYPLFPINRTCNTPVLERSFNESIYMASQYYYRIHILGYHRHDSVPQIKLLHVFVSFFIWAFVCVISMFGVKRVVKVTMSIQLVLNAIAVFSVSYGMMLGSDTPIPQVHEYNRIKNMDFWVEIFVVTTDIIVITDMIYMGTLKPKSLTSSQAGILIGFGKGFFLIVVMFFTNRCAHLILGHYRFLDTRCLIAFGHDVMFSFVPDVLYRVRFGLVLTILWYLGIIVSNINVLVLTIIGMVSAITEKFKTLRRFRLLVFCGICGAGFLGSIYFCTNLGMNTIYIYRTYGDLYFTTAFMIVINLALMFVYSINRIMEDYTFTYGNPPKKFYVTSWQTFPLLAIFVFLFVVSYGQEPSQVYMTQGTLLWSYIHTAIMLIPIFVQILTKCFKHLKYRTLKTVTKPGSSWGPGDALLRHARKYFYPQRDIRYRNTQLVCQHRCIYNSDKYFDEHVKQITKMREIIHKMGLEIRRDVLMDMYK
ncbi:sodium- and chloride-dependent glycine transporter 1-like [Onthophagus taurus]|uniref:sodium- and chloride-dependent glycine transporter 1-like n=1 Tax=Onthophagus taurus TaxID=166361 RepID=UPI000C1FFBA3|nr:sodium- and chloride-dependent glycine transporter 1-like [Onthophagus taurus]